MTPGWQLLFASFAAVVVLLEMVRGWRLGLMRQLVRIVAVIAAYACAVYGGRALLPFARGIYKTPDVFLSVFTGALLACVVYVVITSLGVVLFKRTSQHNAPALRLVWGSSGAFLGLFFGVLFVWLVFAGVRLIGSLAAAQMRSRDALSSVIIQPVWNRPLTIEGKRRPPQPENGALMTTLAQMKASLENGSLGAAVKEVDPVPPSTYRTLEKVGAVASNVESAERFLTFPGAREIAQHPKVVALRNDPEVVDLIAHGRILDLLHNQRLIDAMNDPALRERMARFDLERGLDYALQRH